MRLSIYDNIGIVAQDIEELLKIIKEIADRIDPLADFTDGCTIEVISQTKLVVGQLQNIGNEIQRLCQWRGGT